MLGADVIGIKRPRLFLCQDNGPAGNGVKSLKHLGGGCPAVIVLRPYRRIDRDSRRIVGSPVAEARGAVPLRDWPKEQSGKRNKSAQLAC